jgi:hypothetical protein
MPLERPIIKNPKRKVTQNRGSFCHLLAFPKKLRNKAVTRKGKP